MGTIESGNIVSIPTRYFTEALLFLRDIETCSRGCMHFETKLTIYPPTFPPEVNPKAVQEKKTCLKVTASL